ncbi:MAG: cytochrome c [Desulfobacterales bacterium]|jgi:mono/diheme cytochrome c family protein
MIRISRYRLAVPLLMLLILPALAAMAAGDELATGQKLYTEKCQICHGADGRGNGPAAAALNPKPADFNNPSFWQDHPREKISRTVANGKGMMPAFSLSDDEVKAITDYMEHTFKK